MSQQYFTDNEWSMLKQSPKKAVTAVVLSDKTDPVFFLKEVRAAVQILLDEQQQGNSSDLVNALLASIRQEGTQETAQGEERVLTHMFQALGELQNLKDANEGRTLCFDHLKQVSQILAAKVTLKQAEEFRQWLLSISSKVAEAVKEGGFRGFGGERISRDEAATIKQIEQALELKV